MAISAATIPPAFPVCSHHRFMRALTVDARSNQLLKPTALHVYEVSPAKDKRGVDLISDALALARAVFDRIIPLLRPRRIRHNSR